MNNLQNNNNNSNQHSHPNPMSQNSNQHYSSMNGGSGRHFTQTSSNHDNMFDEYEWMMEEDEFDQKTMKQFQAEDEEIEGLFNWNPDHTDDSSSYTSSSYWKFFNNI